MSRIAKCFARLRRRGEGALIPFLVAGDPNPEVFPHLLRTVAQSGADIIELGAPFSDPLADGAVIQEGFQRALAYGVTVSDICRWTRGLRAAADTPVVIMTCYNLVLQHGLDHFAEEAAGAGVDGVLVTDLPPEESSAWEKVARARGLDRIFLLAPTSTPERIRRVARRGSGFIYAVSRLGVTGARAELPPDLPDLAGRIRACTDKPIAVGFGISRPEHVRAVCRVADGAVVGSAIVRQVASAPAVGGRAESVGEFVRTLKQATKRGQTSAADT